MNMASYMCLGACFIIAITHLLVLIQAQSVGDTDDFINPYVIDNAFKVDCGNTTHHRMRIVYRGDALSLYAADAPRDCVATEVESLNFELANAMEMNCPVMVDEDLEVYTLDLVVQVGVIHKNDDPRHMVTCSYELSGIGQTGEQEADDSLVQRIPELQTVDNQTAESDVELFVFDAQGNELDTAVLGTYIQLRAIFYPAGDEVSFKVWNCKAYADDSDYYIVMSGCGDGDVIPLNRGFYTMSYSNSRGATRIAKSYYFQSFSLPGSSTVQFWCDYVVCSDTSCDGFSCENAASGRRRRDLSNTTLGDGAPKRTQAKILRNERASGSVSEIPSRSHGQSARNHNPTHHGASSRSGARHPTPNYNFHNYNSHRSVGGAKQDVPDLGLPTITSGPLRIIRPGEEDGGFNRGTHRATNTRLGTGDLIRDEGRNPGSSRGHDFSGGSPDVAPRGGTQFDNYFTPFDMTEPSDPDSKRNTNEDSTLSISLLATMACVVATLFITVVGCLVLRRCTYNGRPPVQSTPISGRPSFVTVSSPPTNTTTLLRSPGSSPRPTPRLTEDLTSMPSPASSAEDTGLGDMLQETSFSSPSMSGTSPEDAARSDLSRQSREIRIPRVHLSGNRRGSTRPSTLYNVITDV